ncbi:hypothetical protein KAH55_01725, partial [bacterium]|nr:hypothetical protein [bacterium]
MREGLERTWFHVQGEVLAAWQGRRVVGRIVFGGKGLVFSSEGIPVMPLSYNSIWSAVEVRRERIDLFAQAADCRWSGVPGA